MRRFHKIKLQEEDQRPAWAEDEKEDDWGGCCEDPYDDDDEENEKEWCD